jgi:hypothetical protein
MSKMEMIGMGSILDLGKRNEVANFLFKKRGEIIIGLGKIALSKCNLTDAKRISDYQYQISKLISTIEDEI